MDWFNFIPVWLCCYANMFNLSFVRVGDVSGLASGASARTFTGRVSAEVWFPCRGVEFPPD